MDCYLPSKVSFNCYITNKSLRTILFMSVMLKVEYNFILYDIFEHVYNLFEHVVQNIIIITSKRMNYLTINQRSLKI
jgi:hypothetical protein